MKNTQVTLMRYIALALAIVPVATGNVVTDWNTIASTTIVKNGGKAPGGAAVWFSYESLAVYDAVNAITGQYRPFYYYGNAPRNASIDAAVAAAAHRVLVNYFPSQQTALDAQFAASLSTISPGDGHAKDAGSPPAKRRRRRSSQRDETMAWKPLWFMLPDLVPGFGLLRRRHICQPQRPGWDRCARSRWLRRPISVPTDPPHLQASNGSGITL